MATYECVASLRGASFDAHAEIGRDAIVISGAGSAGPAGPESRLELGYEDLMDMRLLNYRLLLDMRSEMVELSKLGYQTEDFFEKLWAAYARKSSDALFVGEDLVMASEGDYAYTEGDLERKSIAKLELYTDSLSIFPHDAGARRVPLCFAGNPVREGFSLELELDTGESYRIARLGNDTDPFFERLSARRDKAVKAWDDAHRALEHDLSVRLGDASEAYRAFSNTGAAVACGLFSPYEEEFWFAAIGVDRCAVELVTDEQTATYLYRFDCGPERFCASLRHAMEAVKKNRRLIYLPEEELVQVPLYRMSAERSVHVRFLRACNAGRIIHTGSWAARLAEFFE